MAKSRTKTTTWRKAQIWVRHHQALTVLGALILATVLYFTVSDIVWQVQVSTERKRYVAAEHHVDSLKESIASLGSSSITTERSCSYSSNGAVFATKFLGCEFSIRSVYVGLPKADAQVLSRKVQALLVDAKIDLQENKGGFGPNDLAVYGFMDQGLNCVFVSTYYGDEVPELLRNKGVPASGLVTDITIGCSGPAKAEYFPVVNN